MTIDTREKPINIKNLVVEKPKEPVRPFDAETEITKEDWEVIDEYINMFPKVDRASARLLNDIKILSPKHFESYHLTEPDWEKLNNQSLINKQTDAEILSPLFPQALQKLGIDSRFISVTLAAARQSRTVYSALTLGRLFPERLHELATEDRWNYNNKILREDVNEGRYDDFSNTGAQLRLTFPDRKIPVTSDQWIQMRKHLRNCMKYIIKQGEPNNEDWSYRTFISIALNMKILAANEVKVNKDGIHLIFNPKTDLGKATPPLPENKKF